VQLLCNRGATLGKLQAQLTEVLLHQCHADVLGAEIARVARPWYLADGQHPARSLFLNPEHVNLYVPDFVEALPLRHPDGSTGVHAKSNFGMVKAEVLQER